MGLSRGAACGWLLVLGALVSSCRGQIDLSPFSRTADTQREAASETRACLATHGMQQTSERIQTGARIQFKACSWPPAPAGQADGFTQISVITDSGPGAYESTGTNYADRITAPCRTIVLAYTYQNMGVDDHRPEIRVAARSFVTVDGTPWLDTAPSILPFYPQRDETVVLRNGKYRLDTAGCAPDR